jgi:hypothetical protein
MQTSLTDLVPLLQVAIGPVIMISGVGFLRGPELRLCGRYITVKPPRSQIPGWLDVAALGTIASSGNPNTRTPRA